MRKSDAAPELLCLTALALSGCSFQLTNAAPPPAPPVAVPPSPAEQVCLHDVAGATTEADVVVLDSVAIDDGTQVIVGVGPVRARWFCVAFDDGRTSELLSLSGDSTA